MSSWKFLLPLLLAGVISASAADKKIVLLAGSVSHGKGEHEFNAGCQLLKKCLDSVPGINQIPILKYLFGSRTRSSTDTTLFVFIRPTILRDDKFADLKYLSGRAAEKASIGGDFTPSNPIPMR